MTPTVADDLAFAALSDETRALVLRVYGGVTPDEVEDLQANIESMGWQIEGLELDRTRLADELDELQRAKASPSAKGKVVGTILAGGAK